jgi:hypothetical protein
MYRAFIASWVLLLCSTVGGAAQTGNLLPNPGFENLLNGSAEGWKPLASGYAVDLSLPHTGTCSVRCDNQSLTDVRAAYRVVFLNQTAPAPLQISGWSKAASVSGVSDQDYSIYVDVYYADGTRLNGQAARFSSGTHGWEQKQATIFPAKPVSSICILARFARHTGTAWFDDLAVSQLAIDAVFDNQQLAPPLLQDGQTRGWFARDVAAKSPVLPLLSDTGAPGSGAQQLGLQLTHVQTSPDSQMVTGTLVDTVGTPRAVTLYYVERFNVANPVWWNDIRRKAAIGATGDSSNQISVGVGATGSMSLYPFGCVTEGTSGRAVGVPPLLGPRITRIGYSGSAKLLYVAFDLALTSDSWANSDGAGYGQASVGIVRYNVDPVWGFRDAAARYYAMFPDAFKRRGTAEGLWFPGPGSPSAVQNPADFRFAYHWETGYLTQDHALGILSFRYSDPTQYWMTMAPSAPRTYDAAVTQLNAEANGTDLRKLLNARAVVNSGIIGADDRLGVQLLNAGWIDGADWVVNPSPAIPATANQPTKASLTYTTAMANQIYAPGTANMPDGEFLDSMEAFRNVLDFSPVSLWYARTPPTFTTDSRQPVVPEWFSLYELAAFMSTDLHQRGKLLMANGTGWNIHAFLPLLDAPGAEVEWLPKGVWKPDSDAVFNFRRTLSYHKPFLMEQNTDFNLFGPALVEKYFQRSMFYGIYPGMFHSDGYTYYYWLTPSLYNRDRPLFVKYLPVIQRLSAAGWEPVTYAGSSNPVVYVERFGSQYLTVLNDSTNATSSTITIDLAHFLPAPLPASVQITDEISGTVLATVPGAGTVSLPLSLSAEQARVLRLSAAGGT